MELDFARTASLEEVIWTSISLGGLLIQIYFLQKSFRKLKSWSAIDPKAIQTYMAGANFRRSVSRFIVMTFFLLPGIVALFLPPPIVREVSLLGTFIIFSLIVAEAILVFDSVLDFRLDLMVNRRFK